MPNEDSIQLYTALHRLGRQMHRFSHRPESGQGSYREQSRLLRLISGNDGAIQRDIAEEMDVRPSSMTEMLVKMEQLGYIIRKQDEKDQRVMHIYLTNEGKAAAEESVNTTGRLTKELFKSLSDEEIKQMLEIASKLCDNLDSFASDDHAHGVHHEHHGFDEKRCRHHGHGNHQHHIE